MRCAHCVCVFPCCLSDVSLLAFYGHHCADQGRKGSKGWKSTEMVPKKREHKGLDTSTVY